MREIAIHNGYRIIEILDDIFTMSDLEGDTYNPEINTDISAEQLLKEQRAFRSKVTNEGVWGYVLEKWNPAIGVGWEHVDSCFGFVGEYDSEKNRHYIIDEFLNQINPITNECPF